MMRNLDPATGDLTMSALHAVVDRRRHGHHRGGPAGHGLANFTQATDSAKMAETLKQLGA